jgi:hypothetical protein
MSWWSDLVAAVESASGGESNVIQSGGQTAAGQVTVPAGPIGGLVTTIQGIYAGVTDGKFWRSLGWLLLGIVLMLLGVASYIGMQKNPVSVVRRLA